MQSSNRTADAGSSMLTELRLEGCAENIDCSEATVEFNLGDSLPLACDPSKSCRVTRHFAPNNVPGGKEAADIWSRRQVQGGCTPEPPQDSGRVQGIGLAVFLARFCGNMVEEVRLPQSRASQRNPELNQVCAGLTG